MDRHIIIEGIIVNQFLPEIKLFATANPDIIAEAPIVRPLPIVTQKGLSSILVGEGGSSILIFTSSIFSIKRGV